jgi:hypothetical protein
MKPGGYCLSLLICAVSLFGCDGPETTIPLTVVRGKVTYLERPVAGGSIVFIPDEERGASGTPVHAEIQADGTYSIRTGEHAGIRPGAYRVTVRSAGIVSPGGGFGPPETPERYSDPRTSGLSCKVQAVEEHTINFHLQ